MELSTEQEPEGYEHDIIFTDKYEFDTAVKMYKWLKYKLIGFKSIEECPNPEKYLKNPQQYADEWAQLLISLKEQPAELVKAIRDNHLSIYLLYMRNFCIQENLVVDSLNE